MKRVYQEDLFNKYEPDCSACNEYQRNRVDSHCPDHKITMNQESMVSFLRRERRLSFIGVVPFLSKSEASRLIGIGMKA